MPTKQPNYKDLAYYFMVLIIKYRDMNCDKKKILVSWRDPPWVVKKMPNLKIECAVLRKIKLTRRATIFAVWAIPLHKLKMEKVLKLSQYLSDWIPLGQATFLMVLIKMRPRKLSDPRQWPKSHWLAWMKQKRCFNHSQWSAIGRVWQLRNA
jgi:hypothetical protein